MKKLFCIFLLGIFVGFPVSVEAQILRKISKKVEKKVERTIEEKTNEENEEPIEEEEKNKEKDDSVKSDDDPVEADSSGELIQLFSKYDFVPGDIVIFEDLVQNEQNGEFPSKWDLKAGNVEIARFGNETVINFPSTKTANICPLMKETTDYLPEKFTIEFDAYFSEFCTEYTINLYDMVNQKNPEKLPYITIRPESHIIAGRGKEDFKGNDNYPYWQHVAISFNIRSLKVYFGEQRIINIPNLKANPTGFTIGGHQCHDGQASLIKNIRIAEGSMSLYERVVTDGKFITTGIRFDSGKATLRPESMGVINSIYSLMSEHTDLNFSVEGHTDNDGDEASNQKLSEDRAAAVKNILVSKGIDASRLTTKGYGESTPMDTNNTPEGKANNRRVEFIKV
jgi:outer membrane protein OmpA-like peptidoglycan-associated protein